MSKKILSIVFLFAIHCLNAFGQSDREKILLPVSIGPTPVQGDRGSRWVTSLLVTNKSEAPAVIEPYEYGCGLPICVQPATPPGITFQPIHTGVAPVPGVFFLVERGRAADFSISLRAQDVSRQSQTYGTELPVVHENQFARTVMISDVPVSNEFRLTLRIYELTGISAVPVTVRVFGISNRSHPIGAAADVLLGETDVTLQPITLFHPGAAAHLYPAYAQLGTLPTFADFRGFERVRIQVTAQRPEHRIWAFVAVINNETQHMTVRSQ